LLPPEGNPLRFTQLYIYDTENEVSNRIASLNRDNNLRLDPNIVEGLLKMFDEHNQRAKVFRMVKDQFKDQDLHPIRLRLIGIREKDGRLYSLPTTTELAALIVGSGKNEYNK